MVLTQRDDSARLRGHVSMKALLIRKYVLEGRSSGWLGRWLGLSRWTVIDYVKFYRLPVRGPRIVILSPIEREHWEYKLKEEIERRANRTAPILVEQ